MEAQPAHFLPDLVFIGGAEDAGRFVDVFNSEFLFDGAMNQVLNEDRRQLICWCSLGTSWWCTHKYCVFVCSPTVYSKG